MVIIQTTSLIYDRSARKLAVASAQVFSERGFACHSSIRLLFVASGQNESAPETGTLPNFNRSEPSGSDLGRFDLEKLTGARDRDRPRLHRLRDFAHEVDV